MKANINVSKTIAINTENYNSVKPSVSITLKDVDIKDMDKLYKNLSDLASNLLYMESIEMCDNSKTIQEIGIDQFLNSFKGIKDEMEKENKKLIRNLYNE